MKRIYLLNGNRIDSATVAGFLHRAWKERGECAWCLKKIEAGQEYIALNTFDPLLFHKECFGKDVDRKGDIIGVSTKNIIYYGIEQRVVICEMLK